MSPISTLAALLSVSSLTSALPSLRIDQRADSVPFDAAQQYVSNKGEHAFIAPGPNDARSPCPALNIMANHNYIPRDGLVTLPGLQQGLIDTFGLSPDFATVLSLFFVGSTPKEGKLDISAFPDYLVGETAYQFIQVYGIGTINAADPMKQICTNYKAINGSQYRIEDPFSTAGGPIDELQFRTFGNKSAEYPRGSFDDPQKLSFLAMTPNNDGTGTFTWHKFNNAIPDNWYKSSMQAPFDTLTFVSDMLLEIEYGCQPDPKQFLFGDGSGNGSGDGSSDSTTDFASLTNGAYSNTDLLDTNNFMCFLAQAAPLVLPAVANNAMFDDMTRQGVAAAVNSIQQAAAVGLSCPITLKSMNLPLLSDLLGIQL